MNHVQLSSLEFGHSYHVLVLLRKTSHKVLHFISMLVVFVVNSSADNLTPVLIDYLKYIITSSTKYTGLSIWAIQRGSGAIFNIVLNR